GYSIIKLSPKHGGPDNLAMGIQVIAPGGYVREHSHTPNQEILFCFAGKGTIIVDGVPQPFVPGTTVYAAPGVRHKIINDGPDELKMTWTYLPSGLDDFFAAMGRPREPGEPAPEPFARPADVHATGAGPGAGARVEGCVAPAPAEHGEAGHEPSGMGQPAKLHDQQSRHQWPEAGYYPPRAVAERHRSRPYMGGKQF